MAALRNRPLDADSARLYASVQAQSSTLEAEVRRLDERLDDLHLQQRQVRGQAGGQWWVRRKGPALQDVIQLINRNSQVSQPLWLSAKRSRLLSLPVSLSGYIAPPPFNTMSLPTTPCSAPLKGQMPNLSFPRVCGLIALHS